MSDSDSRGVDGRSGVLARATAGEVKPGTKRSAEVAELDQGDHSEITPAKTREHVPESDSSNAPATSDKKAAPPSSESSTSECGQATISRCVESSPQMPAFPAFMKLFPHLLYSGRGASLPAASGDIPYRLVSEESEVQPALATLREQSAEHPFLAVDCEGKRLSRRGKLSLVSVATHGSTYLFDIQALGPQVFQAGLKELLEDPGREKLMFDCRADSDCLWHLYQVRLANVVDLQLLQVIYRETRPEPEDKGRRARSVRNCIPDQPRVRGLLFCLKTYLPNEEAIIQAKANGKYSMDRWMKRPLTRMMLSYAAADVQGFLKLYDELKVCLVDGRATARLRQASRAYLDFYRSRAVREYDEFEQNPFLPWRILPPADDAGCSYGQQIACVGCRRRFPRGDFSNIQLRNKVQKCPVCKRVKEEMDKQAVWDKDYAELQESYDGCDWGDCDSD